MVVGMPPLEHRVAAADGASLCVFEWNAGARGRDHTLVLAHATGFHGRCWDQIVAHLDGRHVLAVDQRGHGRSDGTPPVDWRMFGRDLAELMRAFDLRDAVGVGHSMGGYATTVAAAAEPERYRRLVLIDPVIGPPDAYVAGSRAAFTGTPHPTAKRRARWTSPAEMLSRFRDRPPFDTWNPAVLRDYVEYGLLPDRGAKGWVLACDPAFEAAVYMSALDDAGVHDSVARVSAPVLVVRAKEPPGSRDRMDFRFSPTWPGLASAFRRGREIHVPDRTHFVPMEDPAQVARWILDD
jgi:pimeloyl-ACP methyl ester carboxylesterase